MKKIWIAIVTLCLAACGDNIRRPAPVDAPSPDASDGGSIP